MTKKIQRTTTSTYRPLSGSEGEVSKRIFQRLEFLNPHIFIMQKRTLSINRRIIMIGLWLNIVFFLLYQVIIRCTWQFSRWLFMFVWYFYNHCFKYRKLCWLLCVLFYREQIEIDVLLCNLHILVRL